MFRHNVQAAASASGLIAIQALSLNAMRERAERASEGGPVAQDTRAVKSNRAPPATNPVHRF